MKPSFVVVGFAGLLWLSRSFGAAPVMRMVKSETPGVALLKNGNFEKANNGKPTDWAPAPGGFSLVPEEGRSRSQALRCENTKATGWVGASQTLVLNRTNVFPLVVRGWSKAQEIAGSPDSGYSLYVDILYQDDTPLWGQTANFRTGTHGWQQRELLILPAKPVKSLTLHCILRGHSGTAWFDDLSLEEVTGARGAVVFEGIPVQLGENRQAPLRKSSRAFDKAGDLPPPRKLLTQDGLQLKMEQGAIRSLKLGGKEFGTAAPSGFLARDVAAGSDIYTFDGAQERCPDLQLKLQTEFKAESSHVVCQGRLSDTSGKDRAVTLFFSLPVDATGWSWGDDIRRHRPIKGDAEIGNVAAIGCGATGTMSVYPLAAIYNAKQGLALGLDMAHPAQYRLCYHQGSKQFFIAWDFGLVPETAHFPASADFRFVLFRFDPQWGFRAAFQKFTEIFADHFRVRSHDQGIWMPFTDIGTVRDWQDFGFKYHEGNNNVPWDDAHGILSFRYTEPMTWWMPMAKEAPRTMSEAVRVRNEMAQKGDGSTRSMAQVSQVAAMWDDSGQPGLTFRDTPWCNGAVWSLNPNPDLPGDQNRSASGLNAATVHWNPSLKDRLYGPDAKGLQDGEYLDSIEGYVTTDLNFRREHFRRTTVPLTFASDTKEPALFKGLAVFEFTRWLSEDVHRLGRLMFANGVPYRLSFLCPSLDVLGTETDWLNNGKYAPASDSQMCLWRTMSGAKPYLLLMNTDFDVFTPELVERYFQRSLFYGMFPSMFSHNAADNPYWQSPKWYNRDRALFKKYIPTIKRVAEAGWQPVTLARCDNPRIYLERFGPGAEGKLYLTFLNDSGGRQSGTVQLDMRGLRLKADAKSQDLLSGAITPVRNMSSITLEPQQATVFEFSRD